MKNPMSLHVKETVEELLRVAMKSARSGSNRNADSLMKAAARSLYPDLKPEVVEHEALCNTVRERLAKQERDAAANEEEFVRVGQMRFDDFDIPEHSYPPSVAHDKTADAFCEWVETLTKQSAANVDELKRHLAAAERRHERDKTRRIAAYRVRDLMRDMGYDTSVITYEQAIEIAKALAAGHANVPAP